LSIVPPTKKVIKPGRDPHKDKPTLADKVKPKQVLNTDTGTNGGVVNGP